MLALWMVSLVLSQKPLILMKDILSEHRQVFQQNLSAADAFLDQRC